MKASVLTMRVPPFARSPMFTLSAAGFIATRTLGWSPGVRMSWSAKCTWKPETPGQRAGGRADLGREVGQRREVVPEDRRLAREAIAGELHAVAGVAGEADHDPFELLDGLRRGHSRGIADAAALAARRQCAAGRRSGRGSGRTRRARCERGRPGRRGCDSASSCPPCTRAPRGRCRDGRGTSGSAGPR